LSCEKQESELNYSGIIIGDCERSDVNYFTKGSFDSFSKYDLDLDDQSDFNIEYYDYYNNVCNGGGCYIYVIDTSFSFSVYNNNGERFSLGDTINEKVNFQTENFNFYEYSNCFSPEGTSWSTSDSYWRVYNGEIGYIAVCIIKPEGKKFG